MPKTANIYARVDSDVKEQSEQILKQLGLPMSNAIGLFLRQIIIQQGLPFDIKLNKNQVLSYANLSEESFNIEMEKGYSDMLNESVLTADEVSERMNKKYGI